METLGFAGSLAIGSLSLVCLTAHELSVDRVVHIAESGSDKREPHLTVAA